MVITLSFNLSNEDVSRVYIVKIWNKDIRYNIADLLIIADIKYRPNVLKGFKWFQNQDRVVLICKHALRVILILFLQTILE